MRNGLLITLLSLSLFAGATAAETVYVHDQLRLGVRAAPDAAEKSIAVVKTGDALEVLGEQEDFIHIRTESGLEGWVSKGYVSVEPPAQNRLPGLQRELDALKKQQATLNRQLDEGARAAEQQQTQLTQLQEENARLQEQLGVGETLEAGKSEQADQVDQVDQVAESSFQPALIWLSLLVVSFLAGLIIGIRWKAQRVAERIGGLQI